ncbi:MAG: GNAT family N-acetyltransferase [Actinomycetota bacterium]
MIETSQLPPGISLREWNAEEDSLVELTDLLHRSYAGLAEMGLRYVATYQDEETTARRIAGVECTLALLDNQMVGTVTFRPPGRSRGCPWYDHPDVASFGQFCVDPDLRRVGLGSALLDHVEARAAQSGAAEIACDTAEQATHLIEMYEARGYRFIEYADWRPMTNFRSVVLSKTLPTAR